MGVKVIIAETFKSATGGIETVEVEGETVGQCLEEVVRKFPGLQKLWFREKGKLASYLLILLNGENIRENKLTRAVKDGDEICPLLIIGGG
jgi:molybdopterin converting factor small subunit